MACRDLKEALRELPSHVDWKPRFNLHYVKRILSRLRPRVRDRAWKTFSEGPDPPLITLEERGLSSRNFENPHKLARDLLSEPSRAMQMIKLFKKMVFVGGASRLLPQDRNLLIFGHKILSMPGFIVTSKGKDRYVCNLSKKPFAAPYSDGTPFPRLPRSVSSFTLNKGFEHRQTTMGFHGLGCRGASALALPPGTFNINLDLKGWFFQIPQIKQMLHYQVKTFPVPLRDDPNGPVSTESFVLMGTEMGNAVAAAAAGGANIAIVRGFDRKAQLQAFPDLLSLPLDKVVSPAHFKLKPCDISLKNFLKRYPTKHTNDDNFVHLDHTLLGLWRTGAARFPLYAVHQDDVALKNVNKELTIRSAKFLYKEYANCNILTSTAFSEDDVLQEDIITGIRVNFRTKMMSLSHKKWEQFTFAVYNLVVHGDSVTAGEALETCGRVMHAAELFPDIKPMFVPLSHYLSALCVLCKSCPRKWEKAKARRISVPRIILRMLHDGWMLIVSRETHALRFVHIQEDADSHWSTDWCPEGMGFVDCLTGNYVGVSIPQEHPMTIRFRKNSLFGELFIVTLSLIVFAMPGQIILLDEDNMGCIHAIKKFKSKPSYSLLSMRFAQVIREKRLTVLPHHVGTKIIAADPISRMDLPGWKERFEKRCAILKIPKGHELPDALASWENLWEELIALEDKYSQRLSGIIVFFA